MKQTHTNKSEVGWTDVSLKGQGFQRNLTGLTRFSPACRQNSLPTASSLSPQSSSTQSLRRKLWTWHPKSPIPKDSLPNLFPHRHVNYVSITLQEKLLLNPFLNAATSDFVFTVKGSSLQCLSPSFQHPHPSLLRPQVSLRGVQQIPATIKNDCASTPLQSGNSSEEDKPGRRWHNGERKKNVPSESFCVLTRINSCFQWTISLETVHAWVDQCELNQLRSGGCESHRTWTSRVVHVIYQTEFSFFMEFIGFKKDLLWIHLRKTSGVLNLPCLMLAFIYEFIRSLMWQ